MTTNFVESVTRHIDRGLHVIERNGRLSPHFAFERDSRLDSRYVVREGVSEVPSTAVVEMSTTRSVTSMKINGYDWNPLLFFSEIVHHILAVHQRGRFINEPPAKAAFQRPRLLSSISQIIALKLCLTWPGSSLIWNVSLR